LRQAGCRPLKSPFSALLGSAQHLGRRLFSKELDAAFSLLRFSWFCWRTGWSRCVLRNATGTVPLMTRQGNCTFDCGGAQIRAHCRSLATVVTIRGEIDAVNADRASKYIRRFILGQNPVVLDMSGVTHFAPTGISLLQMLDEDCGAAGVQWTLVASPAIIELLGDDWDVTRSLHEALHNLADAIVNRRQLVLPLIKKTA
jgi:anti-anti-sigma factor